MTKTCTNCPGATDHDTAHCPLRAINCGALDPAQRLEMARNGKHPEQADGAQGELWAVHAQGPDDLYAAFSREDAEKHAAELNDLPMPEGISVGAVVIPSPWSAAEHWHYLAEQEREHKDAIEGQRRNLAATLLSQNHELMEARAALAQPSPERGQVVVTKKDGIIVAVTRQDAEGRVLSVIAESQPSPAPELESLTRWGTDNRYVKYAEVESIVGALRAEIASMKRGIAIEAQEKSEALSEIRELREERDAAQARVADLEKQEPAYWLAAGIFCFPEKKEAEEHAAHVLGSNKPAIPLYTNPVAQVGQVLEALREAVEYLDANRFNEIGSGSILHRQMRDALAAAPAQGMPSEAELEAAGLGYPLSKEEAVARWNDRNVAQPAQGGRNE